MNIAEMRSQLAAAVDKLDGYDVESGLSDDEKREYDTDVETAERLASELAEAEAREQKRAELREVARSRPQSVVPAVEKAPAVNTRTSPFDLSGVNTFTSRGRSDIRSRALSAIETSSDFANDTHKQRATQIVERLGMTDVGMQVLLTSEPAYRDAFYKAMSGDHWNMTDDEKRALTGVRDLTRALALSDVTGVLVPSFLDPTVILTNDGSVNPFRQRCRVEQIGTNVWTGVTTAGITGGWTGAEGTEVGDDAPSFTNPPVTAYMADAFVPISYQGYEDLRGREGEIVTIIADYKDNLEATAHATGSGSNQPTGLVTALDANTNVEVSTATSNVFAVADVYTAYESLPARYRNDRTTWFANLAIINDIRQFGTDSYNTQTVDLTGRTIPALMGHPILESSAMDGTIGVAGTDNILVVGDPVNYLIADRVGLMVEFIPNLFGTTNGRPTGQRGWMAHWRTGADSINDSGFRLLQAETNS